MVVNDLDIEGVTSAPDEADAPPIVDANAVLPDTIGAQRLKPVAWWDAQIVE
jgi:hypothetical protein